MDRARLRLEQDAPTLKSLAPDVGYASVSTFCQASRRELGCTPAEYWRRVRGHSFPRRARHPASRGASDDEEPAPLDSISTDD